MKMVGRWTNIYGIAIVVTLGLSIFITWVLYQAATGEESIIFDFIWWIPYGDKIGHFSIFGILAFLAVIATRFKAMRINGATIYVGVIVVAFVVLLEELTQLLIPLRSFDWVDLAADGMGILVFAGMARYMQKYLKKGQYD